MRLYITISFNETVDDDHIISDDKILSELYKKTKNQIEFGKYQITRGATIKRIFFGLGSPYQRILNFVLDISKTILIAIVAKWLYEELKDIKNIELRIDEDVVPIVEEEIRKTLEYKIKQL